MGARRPRATECWDGQEGSFPGTLGGGLALRHLSLGHCGLLTGNRINMLFQATQLEASCSGSPRKLAGSPRLVLGPPRHRLRAETPCYFTRLTFLGCAVRPALLPRAPSTPAPALLPLEHLPRAWFRFPSPTGSCGALARGAQARQAGIPPCGHCRSTPWAAAPLQVNRERHAVERRPHGREAVRLVLVLPGRRPPGEGSSLGSHRRGSSKPKALQSHPNLHGHSRTGG